MRRAKCWIYKRAVFIPSDTSQNSLLLDYTNGTRIHDGIVDITGEYPVYTWTITPSVTIPIPLNVPRYNTDSIIKQGEIQVDGGIIKWETIFGKCVFYFDYYVQLIMKYLLIILVLLLLVKYFNTLNY